MSGAIQKAVLRVLQNASHPMSVEDAAQALAMPERTVRFAIDQLHALDIAIPANNRRRGRVWMADKDAVVPEDKRGKVIGSIKNLVRGRGFVWNF